MLKTVLKHKVQTYVGKSLEILLAEGRLYKLIDTLQRKQCFSDDMLDLLPQIEEDIKTLNDDLEHKEQAAKISISRKFPVYDVDDDNINVESDLVESLINHDTSIVYSSKIDPILEEFTGELARIAPIPPEIVEADFDPKDGTSSDDDNFEDIKYVSLGKVNDVNQEDKEFDLDDILQI
ncbi:hypothetical protein Tco_0878318 [Tanacetum coccineum]|uniref:Uncharacterized protein n=1 Tax=Tanacetum coccineum TaxID=301880 RepID=A0ABQ5C011_9ASTR